MCGFADEEGHESWLYLYVVACRYQYRFEVGACLPSEVLVCGRYAHALCGRFWTEILVVNEKRHGIGFPTWYVSLRTLPMNPTHIEDR